MNVLLIDTGYETYELDEPLGIEQLDGYIRNIFGDEIDLTTEWLVENPNYELEDNYDIVLVSGNIYDNGKMNEVVSFYSSTYTRPQIIVGGVSATLSAKAILDKFPNVICVVGEGEETISSIIKHTISNDLHESILTEKIPNIVFVDSNGILRKSIRKQVSLDAIHSLPNRKYLEFTLKNGGLARIEGSRGCDWNKCTFCIVKWKYAGRKRREFLESRIQNDLKVVLSANATRVYFTDEEFFPSSDICSMHRKLNFLNEAKQSYKSFSEYAASTSTRSILHYHSIDSSFWNRVFEVGFKRLFVGIESLLESQLKRYCKGCTKMENLEALQILSNAGIEADVGFIMFDPYLSLRELQENVSSIINSPLNLMTSRLAKKLRVIENTAFFELLNQSGQVGLFSPNGFDYNWEFFDTNVANIYESIVSLEKAHLDEMYCLQSEIRACNSSEDNTQKLIILRQHLLQDLWDLLHEGKDVHNSDN